MGCIKNKKILCRNILENLAELISSKGHKKTGGKKIRIFFALAKISKMPSPLSWY
jgi:hypothetical protein